VWSARAPLARAHRQQGHAVAAWGLGKVMRHWPSSTS
jgi:hypothetical protein